MADLTVREAVVLLDKSAVAASLVAAPNGDVLVIPQWNGQFDVVQGKATKSYSVTAGQDAAWDIQDASRILADLTRLAKDESDDSEQKALIKTAITALSGFIADEATELDSDALICPSCNHGVSCACTDCDCANHSPVAEAAAHLTTWLEAQLKETGRRNSTKDEGLLRQIAALVRKLGIEPEEKKPDEGEEPTAPVAEAQGDPTAKSEKVTFREGTSDRTYAVLSEANPQFEPAERLVWITPIRPGWGNSRDNNYYPPSTLKEATEGGKFNHLKMFKDHPRKSDEKDLPERSVKDWFATTREAVWDPIRQQPRVPIKVHDEGDFRRMQEAPEQVAFSVLGGGTGRPGSVEGRNGRVIEAISKMRSVDWVTEAGAGGGIEFAESASSEETDMDIENVTAEQLAEANPELYKHLIGMGKALAGEPKDDTPAKADAKAESVKAEPKADPVKESEMPDWFKPFAERLQTIDTRESARELREASAVSKAGAAKVVAATIAGSTLVKRVKDLVATRFAEATYGDGQPYADEAALKEAVTGALTEAEAIYNLRAAKSGVTDLGESRSEPEGEGKEHVIKEAEARLSEKWGPEQRPTPTKMVFTADELMGPGYAPVQQARPEAAPVSEAAKTVEDRIAARM